MCQALGINPICKEQLDEALTKQLVQNMPKTGFHLLSGPNSLVPESRPMPKGRVNSFLKEFILMPLSKDMYRGAHFCRLQCIEMF